MQTIVPPGNLVLDKSSIVPSGNTANDKYTIVPAGNMILGKKRKDDIGPTLEKTIYFPQRT